MSYLCLVHPSTQAPSRLSDSPISETLTADCLLQRSSQSIGLQSDKEGRMRIFEVTDGGAAL